MRYKPDRHDAYRIAMTEALHDRYRRTVLRWDSTLAEMDAAQRRYERRHMHVQRILDVLEKRKSRRRRY